MQLPCLKTLNGKLIYFSFGPDIDKLLGEPILRKMSINTGLEIIFEMLIDICLSTNNLSHRIHLLQEAVGKFPIVLRQH
jgi:hypothetical protein